MELRRHIEGFGNFTSVPAVLLRGRAISDLAGDVDIVVDGVVQVDGDNKYLHCSHGGRSEDYEAVIHQILAIAPTWLDGWNSLADSMIWRVPRLRDLNRLVIARD